VSGKVTRYIDPSVPARSNVPPMLGGPSCPPRNVTDRADTVPFNKRPGRDQRQSPDARVVGDPIAKCRSSVRMDELSLIKT